MRHPSCGVIKNNNQSRQRSRGAKCCTAFRPLGLLSPSELSCRLFSTAGLLARVLHVIDMPLLLPAETHACPSGLSPEWGLVAQSHQHVAQSDAKSRLPRRRRGNGWEHPDLLNPCIKPHAHDSKTTWKMASDGGGDRYLAAVR